jgi:uncharacterized protein (TIGR03435 family)
MAKLPDPEGRALEEQLGLKRESTKAPVDVTVTVIDSIEHPTDD